MFNYHCTKYETETCVINCVFSKLYTCVSMKTHMEFVCIYISKVYTILFNICTYFHVIGINTTVQRCLVSSCQSVSIQIWGNCISKDSFERFTFQHRSSDKRWLSGMFKAIQSYSIFKVTFKRSWLFEIKDKTSFLVNTYTASISNAVISLDK